MVTLLLNIAGGEILLGLGIVVIVMIFFLGYYIGKDRARK